MYIHRQIDLLDNNSVKKKMDWTHSQYVHSKLLQSVFSTLIFEIIFLNSQISFTEVYFNLIQILVELIGYCCSFPNANNYIQSALDNEMK